MVSFDSKSQSQQVWTKSITCSCNGQCLFFSLGISWLCRCQTFRYITTGLHFPLSCSCIKTVPRPYEELFLIWAILCKNWRGTKLLFDPSKASLCEVPQIHVESLFKSSLKGCVRVCIFGRNLLRKFTIPIKRHTSSLFSGSGRLITAWIFSESDSIPFFNMTQEINFWHTKDTFLIKS